MDALVTTSQGQLRGVREDALSVFRGVPFAQPPVGPLRWRAPQPLAPWTGVRDATAFGSIAPQIVHEGFAALLSLEKQPQSEDCLYLNVWTPGPDGPPRPVMVWIHGGAFSIGAGSEAQYNGAMLAARGDVVVVTVNYRLGALGFLCVDEGTPGEPFTNFGLLDQMAALRWVRAEIAAFGGDPNNITIFGESAGGMSVTCQVASPLTNGLFGRAIAQSGAGHHALSLEKARATAARFAALVGAKNASRQALADLTTEQILKAQTELDGELMTQLGNGMPTDMPFQPVIDGSFLSELPVSAIRKGGAADVALITGTTLEESKLFTALSPAVAGLTEDDLARAFAARMTTADDVETGRDGIRVYRQQREARGEPVTVPELYAAVDTDYLFTVPSERLATAQAAHNPDTFVYRFDWKSPMGLGACHALELPFMFGAVRDGVPNPFAGQGPAATALASTMMDAWLSFAHTGNPSTPALSWPRYDPAHRPTMVFDAVTRVEAAPRATELACWDGRR